MNDTGYEKWLTQLRKGYLELCVLVTLQRKHRSYGFELLGLFEQAGLEVNEGTVYPLLNRLHKQGWLDSKWETPDDRGHPRRFYQLSDTGAALLPLLLESYNAQNESLQRLLELK